MSDKKIVSIEAYWLTFGDAVKSCGVSPNTFRSWGVEPVCVEGRAKYFTVESILFAWHQFHQDKRSDKFKSVDGDVVDYGEELALKTQQERIRLELQNLQKTGELLPADLFLDAVTLISEHWGASLDSLVLSIKRQAPDIKNSVLAIIEKLRIGMQNELGSWELGIRRDIADLQKGSVGDTKNRAANSK